MNRINLQQPVVNSILNEIQEIVMDTVDIIEDIVMDEEEIVENEPPLPEIPEQSEEEVIIMDNIDEVKQMKVKLDNSIIRELTDKPTTIINQLQQVRKQPNEEHGIYELELEPLESALFHIKLKSDSFVKHFEYNLSSKDNFIHTSHIQIMKKGLITIFINNLTNKGVKFNLMYKCDFL